MSHLRISARILSRAALFAGIFGLAACSSIPFLSGSNKKLDQVAEDEKAGRITMVLGDEELVASSELASTPITLPEARVSENWPQAGANASKVIGHVSAAPDFQIAWRADVGKGSGLKSALTTAPIASATRIYVLDAAQTVRAVDINSGRTQWAKKLEGLTRRDKVATGGGMALEGDTLIVASGLGFVAALDASNGSERWKRRMDAPMTGSPTIKDGRIFVSSNNNEIYALDLSTGEIDWSDQAIAESARVLGSPSPAAVEDFIIAPYSSGEIIAYLASNGQRLWTEALSRSGKFTPISDINDIGARPVLAGGLVFATSQSGILVAIDGRSGSRVWAKPIGSTQAPAVVGNYVFIMGVDGNLACLDGGTGEAYWVQQLPQYRKEEKKKGKISYAGPIIASGRVVVASSEGDILAFSAQTGEEVGRLKAGQSIFLEPIAVGGKLFFLTDEARLIAVQ